MANAYENYQVAVRGASDVERRFMASVYRWMTLGLLVTAGVAFYVALLVSIYLGTSLHQPRA